MKQTVYCPDCQKAESFEGRIPFRTECESCSADLHVCLNCLHYDRYAEDYCRDSDAEPVANKERYNLCEYFQAKQPSQTGGKQAQRDEAKAKLDALFGKTQSAGPEISPAPNSEISEVISENDPQAVARAKLEALFKPKKGKE